MPSRNEKVMHFLLNRRSRPAKTLSKPIPNKDDLIELLSAGARTPDHGKLVPWRFIVLQGETLSKLGKLVEKIGVKESMPEDKIAKAKKQLDDGHLAVAVIEVQKVSEKIPSIEQTYSAGAVCLSLLNAALAAGWGANWLTGWHVYNKEFEKSGLGLGDNETVAGLIYIGTESIAPPDRPRPNLDEIVEWH